MHALLRVLVTTLISFSNQLHQKKVYFKKSYRKIFSGFPYLINDTGEYRKEKIHKCLLMVSML